MIYDTPQLYSDVEAVQCQGKNIVYYKPRKAGKPLCHIYEQRLFTVKDDRFKSEPFLDEVKRNYTDLINRHISNPEQRLKVFDPDSIYLPTKKIGKNNPKAAEIEADNAARQEWNRTADMALISGIEETKILEIKKEEIRYHDLRHSCASLLLANGVPMKQIQEWLGHSDFSTTANIYAHLDYSSKLTSADAMLNGLGFAQN